jgi:hypothetical protein
MLSLFPPAEEDYLTWIESFIANRVAMREAISGYAAVFDPLCKAYPYQAYLSHLDNKNMVYPLLGDDRILSLFVNKLGHSLHDGIGMSSSASFPTGGLAQTGLRFEMHHLQASLAVLDVVRHCVHRNSATPKLKKILEVVMVLAGNWYTTFNGSMILPRVHSKNHFIVVFFHWLYVRWWQRTQIVYSVDSHSLSTFAAELSSYESLHPAVVDAVTMFGVSPKRPFPSGQLEKATGEPILAIEPSPEWTPNKRKGSRTVSPVSTISGTCFKTSTGKPLATISTRGRPANVGGTMPTFVASAAKKEPPQWR